MGQYDGWDRSLHVMSTIVVLLLSIGIPTILGGPVQALSSRLLEKGEWMVTDQEMISDETLILSGNLTLVSGASLRIVDSFVEVNVSEDAGLGVKVDEGAELVLENTTIRSMNPPMRYLMDVHGTLTVTGSDLQDFDTLSLNRSNASFDTSDIQNKGGTVLSAVDSNVSLVSSNIVTGNGSKAFEIIDSKVSMVSVLFKNLGSTQVIGSDISGDSLVTMVGGGIYNFSTAIRFDGTTLDMNGTDIGSSSKGLAQLGGNTSVRNGRLTDNGKAIECTGGDVQVQDSEVRGGVEGIHVAGCSAIIDGNTISNSDTGIVVDGSKATITNNMLQENKVGLSWSLSGLGTIKEDTFFNNVQGAIFYSSSVTIEDSQFSNLDMDIEVHDGMVDLYNTTHVLDDLDPTATLNIHWYVFVKVQLESGGPASFAEGEIVDLLGGTYNFTCGSDGRTGPIMLKVRTLTRYAATEFSPFEINARLGPALGKMMVDVVTSGTATLVLKRPDLYVLDMRTNDTIVKVDVWSQIIVTVVTKTHPMEDVDVELYVDGERSTNDTLDLPLEMTELNFPFLPDKEGEHVIEFRIDPNNRIQEANETNNNATYTINAVKGNGGGGNVTGKPDLHLIGLSQSNAEPFAGSSVTVTVEIQNSGDVAAKDALIRLYLDGDLVGDRTISKVEAQHIGKADFTWQATEGTHTVRVDIDPLNTIDETNEKNNVYESEIKVGGNGTGGLGDLGGQLIPCMIFILIMIVAVVALLVAMSRRSKVSNNYQQPQFGQTPFMGASQPGSSTVVTETTIAPRKVNYTQSPKSTLTNGPTVCKRCGGSNIRFFDDGQKSCKDCRKIFF